MTIFFGAVVALFTTLVAIPPLMSVASKLRLVDVPGPRKLHAVAVPRCGGLAIVPATLLPVVMWLPMDSRILGYLAGALVVAIAGVADDFRSLNYKWKLFSQCIGVTVAMQSGIVLTHLPFCGLGDAPVWLTYPVTALFLLGITNAVNLFDGLDGLAGGCVVLTFSAIALLAYEAEGFDIMLMALAATGAVFGFLRYNTYPASVFMGDGGSQFLGFTAAVLVVLLLETCNRALNPGIALFLLGLPIIDTLMVMTQRILAGRSPFFADRNHTHHKLLSLGFRHYEAVALIYVAQGVFIGCAFALRYASDAVVVSTYLLMAAAGLVPLHVLKARSWRAHPPPAEGRFVERRNLWLRQKTWLPAVSFAAVRYGVAVFLVLAALIPVAIPFDIAILGLSVFGVCAAVVVLVKPKGTTISNAGIFVACAIAAYQVALGRHASPAIVWLVAPYLAMVTVFLALSFRLTRRDQFRVTTQDLLVLVLALAVPNLSRETVAAHSLGTVAAVMVLLFYASAFSLNRDAKGRPVILGGALASLAVIGLRGLWP